MTMPDVSGLPEDVDARWPDDPNDPGRKLHQQAHDLIHKAVKALLPRAEAANTYATAVAVDAIGSRVTTLESAPVGGVATFADVAVPWTIYHRGGGGYLAPENTIEAMRFGVDQGAQIVDGGDFYHGLDGPINSHDSTLDRTTTSVGNVSALSLAATERVVVDSDNWFGGSWGNLKLAQFTRMYAELGGRIVMSPEPKDLASANAIAAMVKRFQLSASVLPTAFNLDFLRPFTALGCEAVLNFSGTGYPTAAQITDMLNAGVRYIGLNHNHTPAQVQSAADAGLKVMVGTLNRHVDRTKYDGAPVTGWVSDDPRYFHAETGIRLKKDPFATQSWFHGMLPAVNTGSYDLSASARGRFTAPNKFRSPTSVFPRMFTLMGWAYPLPPTFTLDLTLTFAVLGSDLTRWGGIILSTTDHPYRDEAAATENVVQSWFRADGFPRIVRKVNGTAGTQVTTATSTGAPAAGEAVPLRIVKTATDVTFSRVGVAGSEVTVAEDRHLPYLHLGQHCSTSGSDSGMRTDWSAVTVT